MKCVFCQGELLEGKDKCDYCGRYQHERVNPVQNQPVNNQVVPRKKLKKSEIGAMVFKTIFTVAIIAVAVTPAQPITALIAFILAGSMLAFLTYNFNPAKIFMGDSGALFSGFLLATLSIISLYLLI